MLTIVRWTAGLGACLVPVAWVVNPAGIVSQHIVLDQFTSVELGLSLCYVMLTLALASRAFLRWALVVGAIVSLGLATWLFVFYNSESFTILRPNATFVTVAVLTVALCLIAGWKASGSETVILVGAFLVLGYFAQFAPIWLTAPPIRLETYTFYMVFGGSGVLGQALQVIATAVIVFLLFGLAFELAGGSRAIGAVALLVAQFGRGAAISVCIIASALFGMISGSATSNVLAAGSFSIPGMKKMGLSPASAGGIEAVASTIGQVMPPVMGAAAFLMANATGIAYPQIALASLAPALLCYLALFMQGEAVGRRVEARDGKVDPGISSIPLRWRDLLHLIPVAGLILTMMENPARPELSGAVGMGLALLVAIVLRGPRGAWTEFLRMLPKASASVTSLVVTAAAVGIMLAALAATGLAEQLTLLISSVGKTSLFLSLLLASVTAFLLGLGLGTSGVYIITGTLLAPGLVSLGVPVIAAHLFVLYSAMLSMITPPVAFASLTAAGLAGAGFYETSNQAMKFGWALFLIPFLIAYSPELVLVGEPIQIALTIAATAMGVTIMAQPIYGGIDWPWKKPLGWLVLLGGLALVLPVLPVPVRAGAAGAALAWVVVQWARKRRTHARAI